MSYDFKYRVLPQEPKYKTVSPADVSLTEQDKQNVTGLGAGGCVLFVVIALLELPASGGLATVLSKDWYHPDDRIFFIAIIIFWSALLALGTLIHFSMKKRNTLKL